VKGLPVKMVSWGGSNTAEQEEALVVREVLIRSALKALNQISSHETSAKILVSSDEIRWWIGIGNCCWKERGKTCEDWFE